MCRDDDQMDDINVWKMTDSEILALLEADTPMARARRQSSYGSAKIEQANAQRNPPHIFDLRRMEIEAVQKIIEAYNG